MQEAVQNSLTDQDLRAKGSPFRTAVIIINIFIPIYVMRYEIFSAAQIINDEQNIIYGSEKNLRYRFFTSMQKYLPA